MFQGFDLENMQKMLEQFNEQAQKYEQELKERTFVGNAGAGMVSISLNGQMQVIDINIDDEALEDKSSLQILLITAFNDALDQASKALKGGMMDAFKGL